MDYLSTDIVNRDFSSPLYKKWMAELSNTSKLKHAKFWEQAMICEALDRNGCLEAGKKGLGFGVGREQLVSLFAKKGVKVTATDQAPDEDSLAWNNGQLADGKESLFYKQIVSRDDFDRNVEFLHFDMNKDNKDFYNKYDFVWSNCVIGHLGSMKLSEAHLKRHARYIKDGGYSVLTTELNISSLTETVDRDSGTIVWRLDDIRRLCVELLEYGLVADRLRLRLREDSSDENIFFDIDDVGFEGMDSLPGNVFITKIPFSNYAITAIQLVFKKHNRMINAKKYFYRLCFKADMWSNTRRLREFIETSDDIKDYSIDYKNIKSMRIEPANRTLSLKLKPGELKTIRIRYFNSTNKPFFSYGLHTPLGVPPLVLSTANPLNRESLVSSGWFSSNRPSVEFTPEGERFDVNGRCLGMHRVLPQSGFYYEFAVKAPAKKGKYKEEFCLVLEGKSDLDAQTRVTVNINVQ